MNLSNHVETLRQQFAIAADMVDSEETREVVARIAAGLEAATRLMLLEAISAAADEITRELAPGAVDVRLRGSEPEFVVTLPPDASGRAEDTAVAGLLGARGEEGGTSRLNLRLPESLKDRIEEAARGDGLSLNSWLVRAAAVALEGHRGHIAGPAAGSQRFTGWVR